MKDFSFSIKIIGDILKVGLPASLSMVIMSFGQAVFNRILVFYSSDSVAAFQIGGRIDMLIFLPIMSIAAALTTIVGMFYGANDLVRLKAIIKYDFFKIFLFCKLSFASPLWVPRSRKTRTRNGYKIVKILKKRDKKIHHLFRFST